MGTYIGISSGEHFDDIHALEVLYAEK